MGAGFDPMACLMDITHPAHQLRSACYPFVVYIVNKHKSQILIVNDMGEFHKMCAVINFSEDGEKFSQHLGYYRSCAWGRFCRLWVLANVIFDFKVQFYAIYIIKVLSSIKNHTNSTCNFSQSIFGAVTDVNLAAQELGQKFEEKQESLWTD